MNYKNYKINNEKICTVKLSNGIKIIFDELQNFNSTSIAFYIKKGSRDEKIEQAGYSHFCEHMIFKGTEKYSKSEIASLFDKMGAYFNAYTTNELIVIYNTVPFYYVDKSIEIILDMINNSVFIEKEVDLERDVIINEIRADFEDPHEKVHEDFISNIFFNYPLGKPIIGFENTVKNAKRDELFQFYQDTFISDFITVIISGKFNKNKIIDSLNTFKFVNFVSKNNFDNIKAVQTDSSYSFTKLSSEQVHIILGTSKFNINGDDFVKYSLLNLILGESMSSVLFQKIREELGLCYSIYSFINKYRFENLFGIYVSVTPENVNKFIDSISNIIIELKNKGISDKQVEDAKDQKIVELIINNDILLKRLKRIALMDIILKRDYHLKNLFGLIKSINKDDLNKIVNDLFIKENFFTQVLYNKNLKMKECSF
ncbi:MAG: insulinase family protein [Spirochaetes bacterium]|nr:insulinase family protein [Spirochaetota bacterium]